MSTKTPADRLKASGIDASRGQAPTMLWPEDVTIIRDPSQPLYDPRVEWPLNEETVLGIMDIGVIQPVVL